ncbi:MAG: RsmB/NOP family class I SAM-dependent RNA methyltransferase [Opitutaceae bacterium]|nr:RsmB/NOP family class I SAM-dependent RNA methyltransferase [Opitutaceae bacterium]
MSVASNQAQVFLRLLRVLRPRWRTDQALPRTIQSLLTGDRSFGSRDRRLYRELIYTTLRHLPWIEPCLDQDPAEVVRRVACLAADLPATQAFRAEFATGEAPAGDRAELLPAWFRAECPEIFSGDELETQLRRAPLWLRLSGAASATLKELAERGWAVQRSEILPNAVRLLDEVDVTQTNAFKRGRIEVQDLGSQMVLETLGITPGGRWLDACAGAGGKSLQLARLITASGTVEAHDIRPSALAELQERAVRAGARNIRLISRPSNGDYDGVLVDAPCSGSGTWRRSPHLKWTTTPALIAERAELQHTLLAKFSANVRPGGRLVYATCSLSVRENEQVAARFLAGHAGFEPMAPAQAFGFAPRGDGLTIFPARHDTDGFFVAAFRRR